MPVFKRLRYALYILIAVTMVLMLSLGIGEGLGFVHDLNVQRLMLHLLYFLPVYAIGVALAPVLSERMPIFGDPPDPKPTGKRPFGYAVRAGALVAFGLALAMLASLVVFLLGKFA
jgi:hypothetical protein